MSAPDMAMVLRSRRVIDLAADSMNYEEIKFLLGQGPIPMPARGRAIVSAALGGHIRIIKLLSPEEISKVFRGEAVVKALGHHSSREAGRVAFELLQSGPITKMMRQEAVVCASRRGDEKNLEFLLRDVEKEGLSRTCIEEAVDHAARQGFSAIVHELLNKGSISNELRQKMIFDAARNNFHETVLELSKDYLVPPELRERAVVESAHLGSFESIHQLLKDHSISDEALKQAFMNCISGWRRVQKKPLETARELLKKMSMSDDFREQALLMAAQKGFSEFVPELLQGWPIPEETRKKAIETANQLGYPNIVCLLKRSF